MSYALISYKDLTVSQHNTFFDFLKEAGSETTQPSHENMWSNDWQNKNYTLPYLLEYTDRFKNTGNFNILFDNQKVVACSGVYTSSFCPKLAIAGTRTWISKEYRNLSIAREYLLTTEKDWAIKNNYGAIAICFNEYNKNIIEIWKRTRFGEKRTPRQPHHLFYNGVNDPGFPVTIQYTKQWIIYEKLDPSFDFDWATIK